MRRIGGWRLLGERFGQEAELECSAEQLRHIPHVQSSHQVKAMHFYGAHADLEHGCDLAIGVPNGDEPQYVSLAGGQ